MGWPQRATGNAMATARVEQPARSPGAERATPGALAQDGARGWVMVGALFVCSTLVFGLIRSLGAFFVEFVQYFQESAQAISWITSIGVATQQLCSPLGTALCNAYDAQRVVMAGGVLASLGLILASQARSLPHLYLTMGLTSGLGWSLVFTPMVATVMAHFTRRRTLALGVGFTGVGVSSFVFAPLFQYMLDNFGWRGSLLILGGLSLNIVPCGALIRPTRKKAPPPPKAGGKADNGGGGSGASAFRSLLRRVYRYLELSLLAHGPFLTYTLAITFFNAGYFVPYVHLVAHSRQAGYSEYRAAFVMSATGAADIVGRVAAGWLTDLGRARLVHMLTGWTGLTGVFIVLMPLASVAGSYGLLLGFGLGYGFCAGALTSLVFAGVPEIVGMGRMVGALGLLSMLESVGGLLGPPLSGYLRDRTGSYITSLVAAGCCFLLGSLILTSLPHYFSWTGPPPPRPPDGDGQEERQDAGAGLLGSPASGSTNGTASKDSDHSQTCLA
ncbi:monocarboxylate transporter 13-like isoform X1 [Gadus chalcogrammus]|uniref:monocarboxylate transporter 13-like isoform X1 n=2 Tax=Gadus chalcogrammus TaxID=1042646 RepID=UPI0024C49BA0|nr:monocarboxylate transporter 13-like isoform X1 [Gadus chalcogrammus]XP_056468445.1 monocarboxylate transporter 13-like isoform X1 [Gadus chalcogrammus]